LSTTSSDSPTAPRPARTARAFYAYLTASFRTESWNVLHRYVAGDAMILELLMTGTVIASLLGLPGKGRRIGFRMLHLFEFRHGLISRENVAGHGCGG
jgi:hypothetical protein